MCHARFLDENKSSLEERLFAALTNPSILLVDLRLFQLLRQLIYHIRSCNCFLCLPQAHRNWLMVFGEQLCCTAIKAIKWISRQYARFLFLDYWNLRFFAISGWQQWNQATYDSIDYTREDNSLLSPKFSLHRRDSRRRVYLCSSCEILLSTATSRDHITSAGSVPCPRWWFWSGDRHAEKQFSVCERHQTHHQR